MDDLPFREVVQLHGIATDNLPPADVTTNYVNIVPAVVTKMSDRGRYRTSASRPRCAAFSESSSETCGLTERGARPGAHYALPRA